MKKSFQFYLLIMKRLLNILLLCVLSLTLMACGNTEKEPTAEEPAEETTEVETVTKEELLAQAVDADATDINNESFENIVRAKQTYCNKVLNLKGMITAIEEDHIVLGCGSTYVIDVYLPIEEIILLDVGQNILVVGETTDELIDSKQEIAEYDFEYIHYQMPTAYLVKDRFELKGKLKGVNTSYAPAFNIQIGDSNVYRLIYFTEDVDTSVLEWDQEITFEAKFVKNSLDWEYVDAKLIQ